MQTRLIRIQPRRRNNPSSGSTTPRTSCGPSRAKRRIAKCWRPRAPLHLVPGWGTLARGRRRSCRALRRQGPGSGEPAATMEASGRLRRAEAFDGTGAATRTDPMPACARGARRPRERFSRASASDRLEGAHEQSIRTSCVPVHRTRARSASTRAVPSLRRGPVHRGWYFPAHLAWWRATEPAEDPARGANHAGARPRRGANDQPGTTRLLHGSRSGRAAAARPGSSRHGSGAIRASAGGAWAGCLSRWRR
jgi:hypothetical protein